MCTSRRLQTKKVTGMLLGLLHITILAAYANHGMMGIID